VNCLARQIAPVRLTGNYGSEILRGTVAFKPRSIAKDIFSPGCVRESEVVSQTYSEEARCNRTSFIAFKQVPWHHFARFAVERSQLEVRSPFLDNELVALAFQAPPSPDSCLELSLRLIAEGNPQLGRIATDRGITYPAARGGNRFRRSVQEFLAKAEYAYDYGMPNWLAQADHWLAPLHLERLFLGRQKFCHFRSWYRDELSGYMREVLLDSHSRQRGYLNTSSLEPMVTRHIEGTANYTLEIHKLLSLELIHRRLLALEPGRRATSAPDAGATVAAMAI
jgi:asparagine synthase (glutamine-hydrolysing)